MGSKSQRHKAFLLQHPRCCFCGGIAPSEEEDHFPSKSLFENKQWPEGFVFPACVSCNRVTRHHEQIVAMLARLYPDPTTNVGRREVHERMRAVAHNFPGLLENMRPTAEDLVLAQEKYGLKVPPGASPEDLPVLSLRSERLHSAVIQFGRKLALALFYKHTRAILPTGGQIAIRWYANAQIHMDEIPRQLASVLNQFPPLIRNNTSLGDQFFYRWGIADTGQMAAFLALFRESFAIVGFMATTGGRLGIPPDVELHGPFSWNRSNREA